MILNVFELLQHADWFYRNQKPIESKLRDLNIYKTETKVV